MTSTRLIDVIKRAVAQAKLDAHPVGSYYWSSEATDPGALFGGTWEQIKDRFLYAVGDDSAAGDTGGEATHTLTEAEMPSHSHIEFPGDATRYITVSPPNTDTFNGTGFGNEGGFSPIYNGGWFGDRYKREQLDSLKGSSQPHNNLPPYVRAYCWRRTA